MIHDKFTKYISWGFNDWSIPNKTSVLQTVPGDRSREKLARLASESDLIVTRPYLRQIYFNKNTDALIVTPQKLLLGKYDNMLPRIKRVIIDDGVINMLKAKTTKKLIEVCRGKPVIFKGVPCNLGQFQTMIELARIGK